MQDEQHDRLHEIRRLVDEASTTVESMKQIAADNLRSVRNDSASQAEALQRIQECAGSVVHTLTTTAEVARHARSYQAQVHSQHSQNKPQ